MASSAIKGTVKPRQTRRKKASATSKKPVSIVKDWLVRNQIRMPLILLSGLATTHLLVPQPYTAKFLFLSHFNPSTRLFNKGSSDWPFVFTWVLFFILLRAVLMRFISRPFFEYFAPRPTSHSTIRFQEQAWNVYYYSISFAVGLYIVRHSPYWGDIREVWADYPQIEMDGFFKAYYLVELAFSLQQVFVLNIEARRKDFWQMFCHHIVTCTLIFMSYTYNVTKVGNVILCIMDFSDILLALAKMLKYFKLQRLCDFTFFLFLISWPYTRHYLYNVIVYSSYVDLPRYFHRDNRNSPFYQITPPKGGGEWGEGYNWNPQQGYYFTSEVHMAFLVLLATLQAILILWFATIIRLASRVIRGAHAEDERSDDEASDYEEDEIQHDPDVTLLEVANGNIPTRTNGGIPSTNGITLSNGIHQRKIAV